MAGKNASGPDAQEKRDRKDRVEAFVSKARDVDEAREFVKDAASVAYGLWLTYLGILIYISITAGAVTHQDLFLERPVKLPFLSDAPLPLVAFFVLAPIVFVIWHAYTLLHFDILAAKVRALEAQLESPVNLKEIAKDDALLFRLQLPANIFVHLLAVPQLTKGRIGFVSTSIAWISLVVGPILLLLLVQIQFLPFHSWQVTWLHRILVLVDLALLWTLWPVVVDGGKEIWSLGRGRRALLLASGAALFVSVALATFPGEWIDAKLDFEWIPPNWVTAWLGAQDDLDRPVWTSLHDLLFSGQYDERSQRRRSLFSNTLVLPNFDAAGAAAIEEAKLGSARQTIARKRGHFEKAVFRGADLRKVNLENAHLEGASFYQANLQDAQMYHAHLEGADFYQAQLEGASFGDAELGRARLREAHLEGAYLANAGLQGVTLARAKLGMATLERARLEGASFDDAEAQGADFDHADLRGARLRGAQLQAASFKNAQLQGACLSKAQLSLADFSETKLGFARLSGASVWRANFAGADPNRIIAFDLRWDEVKQADYENLRARLATRAERFAERPEWKAALARVDKWLIASTPPPADKWLIASMTSSPAGAVQSTGKMSEADQAAEQKAQADQLASLVCSSRDEDVDNIVQGLIRDDNADSIIREAGPEAKGLVDQILSPECLASAYLTSEDKAALAALKEKLAATEDPCWSADRPQAQKD